MTKVEINNLYKIFGKNPERALKLLEEGKDKEEILNKTKQVIGLEDVSMSINAGEIFVVMGLSGSGKSTLIRCLNRLIEPTKGDIKIDGESIMNIPHSKLLEVRRKKMGMVFQSFALLPHLTVLENAAYGLKIQGFSKEERLKKGEEALETVGLNEWKHSYPDNLSGGMQQRVGLARALANDPDILLMDEAFSALDPLIRGDMQDELIELQSKMQRTIIFITHDLDEALKLGDRIALMKDGKVVQIGTPEEILTSPETEYVERFVENVDRTKVLTAEQVMRKPKPVVYLKDGPRVALRKMKEHGISSIFVVDQGRKVQGLLMAEKAAAAANAGDTKIKGHLESKYSKVAPDTIVSDMFELMAGDYGPVAVVNEDNELKGIIIRGDIFQGLTGGGDYNE